MATQALLVFSAASQVASACVSSPWEAFFPLCLAHPLPASSLVFPAVCWHPSPQVGREQSILAAHKTPQDLKAGKCLKSPRVSDSQVHSVNFQGSWEVTGMCPCPFCGAVGTEGKKSTGDCCPPTRFKVLFLAMATDGLVFLDAIPCPAWLSWPPQPSLGPSWMLPFPGTLPAFPWVSSLWVFARCWEGKEEKRGKREPPISEGGM